MEHICTDLLEIYYRETGSRDGIPVILLHGFPYDIHAFDDAVDRLAEEAEKGGRQYRVLCPYLRGYGPTRFLSEETMRSGEQAALASDLLAFMDALGIEKAILGGFDWGGRAACIVSALWPERVIGLVTCGVAYNIQNSLAFRNPSAPEREARSWYVYYFHTARGRQALRGGAKDLCRYLWKTWSPDWKFSEETFLYSAEAFENPDYALVVEHSYCHRTGEAEGDPLYADLEETLCGRPQIHVPSVILLGAGDGVTSPEDSADDDQMFTNLIEKRFCPESDTMFPRKHLPCLHRRSTLLHSIRIYKIKNSFRRQVLYGLTAFFIPPPCSHPCLPGSRIFIDNCFNVYK